MSSLYSFQKQAVRELMAGKHIIVASCGCLAEDTMVRMSDDTFKPIQDIRQGEYVLGYDEYEDKFMPSQVECVIRTCHKPKPMIELEYDGQKVRTTYDHPFFDGDGFYPLYHIIWGALETRQRVQLELLCKQYGQALDHKAIRGKHSCCNETCIRCQRLLQNNDGRQNSKSPSDSGRELAGKPIRLGLCKPHKLQQGGQQSEQFRVVFEKIQRLVCSENGEHRDADTTEQRILHKRTEGASVQRVSKVDKGMGQDAGRKPKKEGNNRRATQTTSKSDTNDDTTLDIWKMEILPAEPYYSLCLRTAPYTYCIGQKHNFITHNTGKTAVALAWLAEMQKKTGKKKICVWTTAPKAKTTDWQDEAEIFAPSLSKSQSLFSVISWHKAAAWVNAHWEDVGEYLFVFDEVQRGKSGVSSKMGKAFLKVAKITADWAGFTATPGDNWLAMYPYFQACGLVRNKTQFKFKYAIEQTFKGYPEIIGWRNEDELKAMWESISYTPDTSQVMAELPAETHKVVEFKKPSAYNKTLKTRTNTDGEFLDTAGALCAELRRLCLTKEKREWVKEFVEGLGDRAVMFYNFIKTGDELEQIITKALPKGARVWRIDGKHHEIPTAETIGKYDIVLCQWQSGSEGLNLQHTNYMVIIEACYSYSVSIQGRGRIRRIGQTRPQFYYYLKTLGTIEEAIYKALRTKSDFAEDVWCMREGINE